MSAASTLPSAPEYVADVTNTRSPAGAAGVGDGVGVADPPFDVGWLDAHDDDEESDEHPPP